MQIATIIGNWKMNTTPATARVLATEIRSRLAGCARAAKVVVCPPFVALETVAQALAGTGVAVGAQNLHPESNGAFTGEISPQMAKEFADFVIVGHSERRAHFGESDEFVCRKVAAASDVGIKPILCVGESVADRKAGDAERIVSDQVLAGLSGLTDISNVIVAYEPVWAIGTGESATPEIAQAMITVIRATLRSQFGGQSTAVPCLYGGSVTADNIHEIVREPDIDGALVGGASLDAGSFSDIVNGAIVGMNERHK